MPPYESVLDLFTPGIHAPGLAKAALGLGSRGVTHVAELWYYTASNGCPNQTWGSSSNHGCGETPFNNLLVA